MASIMNATCSIPECGRPTLARGWCEAHYRRWRKHGDPLYTKRAAWVERHDARDGMKLCSLCGESKPVDGFHVSAACRDGLQQRCIPCQTLRTAQTRDHERAREIGRKQYAADPETARAKRRATYVANRDREREYNRLYHQKNRDRKRVYDTTRRAARAEQCAAWRTPNGHATTPHVAGRRNSAHHRACQLR